MMLVDVCPQRIIEDLSLDNRTRARLQLPVRLYSPLLSCRQF